MSFTDDDLKRLKESENAIQRSLGIPALLARLEAAEKALGSCLRHQFDGVTFEGRADFYEAWLKSKGRMA